jgi:aerobic-type carbon monoxide dehydrogenase small subunit (CoxS/CutS family)
VPIDVNAVTIKVNGREETGVAAPRMLLSDFLRQQLGLTGVHVGCEHGVCGACTVLLDGAPVRSCLMFAVQLDGAEITTIEGLAAGGAMHPMQEAFKRNHGLQCGFCTPGMVLTAVDLLKRHPNPDEATVRETLSGNLCRCTGYEGIVAAVLDAATTMKSAKPENTEI